MDKMSDDGKSLPFGTEVREPIESQLVHDTIPETRIPNSKILCAHQRLIDDVRTRSGKLTGKVRCLECGMIFDEPYTLLK